MPSAILKSQGHHSVLNSFRVYLGVSVWLWTGSRGHFSCENLASTGLGEERMVEVEREPEWTELMCLLLLFGLCVELKQRYGLPQNPLGFLVSIHLEKQYRLKVQSPPL